MLSGKDCALKREPQVGSKAGMSTGMGCWMYVQTRLDHQRNGEGAAEFLHHKLG